VSGGADALAAEIGVVRHSDWMTVDQAMIDRFADATLDHQFIHVDPARAAATPLGGTIAHGFLTLSLLAPLQASIPRPEMPAMRMGLNYGLDRVRFIHPVRSGSRIRAAATLIAIEEVAPGQFQQSHEIVVEIEGIEKPALVATWLTRFII
jgi:acyl dehydratase